MHVFRHAVLFQSGDLRSHLEELKAADVEEMTNPLFSFLLSAPASSLDVQGSEQCVKSGLERFSPLLVPGVRFECVSSLLGHAP